MAPLRWSLVPLRGWTGARLVRDGGRCWVMEGAAQGLVDGGVREQGQAAGVRVGTHLDARQWCPGKCLCDTAASDLL